MTGKAVIIGYYGVGNTGSEIRLHVLIEQLKKADPSLMLSVQHDTLYKEESFRGVEFINFNNANFFNIFKIFRIAMGSDMIVIAEGIPFADFMGKGFLAYALPFILFGKILHKKVVCYAVDIDRMTRLDTWITTTILHNVDEIMPRTKGSLDVFRKIRSIKDIHLTADPALLYDKKSLLPEHRKSRRRRIIVSFTNIFGLPVKAKLFGRKQDIYIRYPTFFTYANDGRRRYARFVAEMSKMCNRLIDKEDCEVFFVVMDDLVDLKINEAVYDGIADKSRARLVRSSYLSFPELNGLLSTADAILSARLHALILSLRYGIPMIGLRVDERFDYFFSEIGMERCLLDMEQPFLDKKLFQKTRELLADKERTGRNLRKSHKALTKRAEENFTVLAQLVKIPKVR